MAVVIALMGIIAFVNLPVEQFPDIAPPVVEVSADYTGASADAVQKSVIVPLEEAINGVDGIDYISSSSTSSGNAFISVVFKSGIDPDLAVVMVKNRVNEAEGILPAEVIEMGIHVEKEQRSYLKVIALECPDNRYDNDFISNYFNINVSPRLQRIKGVSNIQLLGNIYAMRIWMDPKRMAFYELEPSDIEDALNSQNIEAAIGTLGEDSKNTFQHTLVYRGRLINTEEFENIVVKRMPNGGELRLSDVARVELGTESYSSDGWVNSHNGVVAILTQAVGSNARSVNHEIDRLMEQLKPQLPPGLEFRVLLDTNHFLDASINEVDKTLLEAILLVVLVVLLFIQNFRATLIPIFAIIVSLVGTFAFLYVAGFSLNLITLFALVLVIGTVVDDAIVVVEAVQSQFEKGERRPYEATLGAMGNISTAVVTTTVVFMCVFIPTSFISGLSGAYYKQFGLTMAVAVALSTINALTLSPALCALLMKPKKSEESSLSEELRMKSEEFATAPENRAEANSSFFTLHSSFKVAFNAAFDTLREKYQGALSAFMRHKWVAAAITVAAIVLAIACLRIIPTSLIPDEDTGNVFVEITTPAGSTLEQTKKAVMKATKAIEGIDEIESVASVAGWNILGGDGANAGVLIIKLKHWDERSGEEGRIDTVLEKIEERIDSIKTASMFCFPLPTVTGYGFSSSIELNVQNFEGDSINHVKEVADRFAQALDEREEIGEVYNNYEVNFPQYTVSVNAAICKRYGIEPSAVLSTLNGYVGGNYASQFNAFGRLYHVMLQADPELRADPDDLNNIFVVSNDENTHFLPITELATLKKSYGVQSLNRFNLFSSISLEVEPEDGYSTGDAIKAIEEVAKTSLPLGYGYEYTGTTREEAETTDNAIWIYVLIVVFIYLVLCSLYESLFVPLAVLLSIPFGLVGCCVFALFFELENNIYMQVGIIMLMGLLSKTAILLTEYATERRREGLSIREAALEAAKARLRPIIMTAMTLIIGLLPLVFASGAGAMGNISLGLCVIGGMTLGTLSLLFFVPIFFIFFKSLEEKYMPSRIRGRGAVLLCLCSLLLFTSCVTYSRYQPQEINTDGLIRLNEELRMKNDSSLSTLHSSLKIFADPQLVSLIEEGLAHNSDLNIAKLQVDAAKAALRNAKGELFPSLELGANGQTSRFKNKGSSDDEEGGGALTQSTYSFGAEASWEIDIFGRLQNAKMAAAASLEERMAYVQAVEVELVATIATAYYQLWMYDAQIAHTRAIMESWDESIRAMKTLMDVGEATSEEVSQAEAGRLSAEATLEELRLQLIQAENALCTLIGRPCGHIVLSEEIRTTAPENRAEANSSLFTLHSSLKDSSLFTLHSSLKAEMLRNRPDVRQAEAELKRAFYATNEARAALYPSLNLSGSIGWTNDIGEVVSPAGLLTRALASLTQPVFANGRLRAAVRQAQAEQEQAKIAFKQAVLNAGQEVNDILASQQYAQRAIALNTQQVEKLTEVLAATELRMQYDSEVNYLQVLLARQSLLEAQLSLLSNQYTLIESAIGLYRALGGGSIER